MIFNQYSFLTAVLLTKLTKDDEFGLRHSLEAKVAMFIAL